MITTFLVKAVVVVLTGVLSLIPVWSLPVELTSSSGDIGSALAAVNGVFPIADVGICLGIVVAARTFLFAWALIVFLYDRIPFKAT